MITAVDTNVILDVLLRDPTFGERSAATLRACLMEGSLIVCEVVWAELRPALADERALSAAMEAAEIAFSALGLPAALAAGGAWKEYRVRGGRRERLIGDFLVFGHALHQADRLLTRDHGFSRTYFPQLAILDPTVN